MLAVYALLAILPHFASLTHTHTGGELAHTHAFLGVHDENLKREILENIGDASGLKTVSVTEVREESLPQVVPVEQGTHGLRTVNLRHTHFQEDPNLLALGASPALPIILLALRQADSFCLPFVPSLLKFRPIARGPTLFSLSA